MNTSYVFDVDEDRVVLRGSHDECAKWADRHNLKVVGSGGDPCFVVREEPEVSNWERDAYQFPRLLAEISAVGLTNAQFEGLAVSMDLTIADLNELFDRADVAWERVKEETCR